MAGSCRTSASFLSFAFGLQPLRPLQNFVLDFCFQVREIPIIAAVVSVFGKSLRKVGVIIFHTPPRSISVIGIYQQLPGHNTIRPACYLSLAIPAIMATQRGSDNPHLCSNS